MRKNNLHHYFLDQIYSPSKITIILSESDKRIIDATKILKGFGLNILSSNDLNVELDIYLPQFQNLKFTKNWPISSIKEYLADPLIKSLAMLNNNEASGVVYGCTIPTADVIRNTIRVIGIEENSNLITSMFLMINPKMSLIYTFADCAVIPEPSPEQLAEIAQKASAMHSFITQEDSKVAFLSFSTSGSADHYRVKNIRVATKLFSKNNPEIICDGEIQLDAAINKKIAINKNKDTKLKGDANTLIFPNLDAGNIGYKLLERLGGYHACGPLLLGLNKPVNDLSRGSTTDDIVLISLITALQSQGSNNANI